MIRTALLVETLTPGGDVVRRQQARRAQQDPSDVGARQRAIHGALRSGRGGEAAEQAKELVKTTADRTKAQRSSVRRRALKQRLGGARKAAKAEKGFPDDTPNVVGMRKLRTRAQPYLDGYTSAQSSGEHEIADKMSKQLRNLARKHEVTVGEIVPHPDPDDRPENAHHDAELMADLHGSHWHEHREAPNDRTERYASRGEAHFKDKAHAELYGQDVQERHWHHGVDVKHSYNPYHKSYVVTYGIGDRSRDEGY